MPENTSFLFLRTTLIKNILFVVSSVLVILPPQPPYVTAPLSVPEFVCIDTLIVLPHPTFTSTLFCLVAAEVLRIKTSNFRRLFFKVKNNLL